MQTIIDLIWTLMISLQFTSFTIITITIFIQVIESINNKKINIKINLIWLALIIFSTFYLTHM